MKTSAIIAELRELQARAYGAEAAGKRFADRHKIDDHIAVLAYLEAETRDLARRLDSLACALAPRRRSRR